MFFTYTIGLLAAAGIIVPLIIHLWNVKKGKTLKIGSVFLLGESAKQSSKSFQIKDWLLFLLRSLLILMIAFLLAEPFLKTENSEKNIKGWILFDEAKYADLSAKQKAVIKLLNEKGYEIHDFDKGFNKIALVDSQSFLNKKASNIPPFSLIKQLNSQLAGDFKTIVYTDLSQSKFQGSIPKVHLDLEIRSITAKDTLSQSVIYALVGKQDSIKVLCMKSSASQTTFETVNYNVNHKDLELNIENGESFIRFKNQKNWVKVISKPLKIDVYTDDKQDAIYLNSALKAIAGFTKMNIIINNPQQFSLVSTDADWIFWLSEKPFNQQNKLAEKTKLFSYAVGKTENINRLLKTGSSENDRIYKRIINISSVDDNIWTDGFGNAIISKNTNGKSTNFQFYTRLNPQWTDLVWSENFPRSLMSVLFKETNLMNENYDLDVNDKRQIAKNQTFIFDGKSLNKAKTISKIDYSIASYFWIAAFFTFFLERVLTYRKKANG
ncbi:hypothetical protein A5893_08110 [Pedobacter psychrophilus]|uniref:Aerotolerance regulator N-terminal domain-containing protein n=1 Tax=Pedobacter psychrophilus TaxID=1826909 RepID=A0A179DFQ8_9SPHI|nr:BatA domain-containing protein [Pedobacter psychrophilus]OAQ39550.1 hypothetical protein A5893_08110 [Pedobacter psychrophilus]